MREILFKAKRKDNGKWIEGSLIILDADSDFYFIVPEYKYASTMSPAQLIGCHMELVIPETVCQYTGLTDKNGRKIFEGDIVRYIDEVIGSEKVDEVKYNEAHAAFCRLHKSKMGLQYLWLDEAVANKCEVIGNIFDNPELIGE